MGKSKVVAKADLAKDVLCRLVGHLDGPAISPAPIQVTGSDTIKVCSRCGQRFYHGELDGSRPPGAYMKWYKRWIQKQRLHAFMYSTGASDLRSLWTVGAHETDSN